MIFACSLSVCVGVYLPVLWEQSFCWKNPLVLGYTRGHFSALVAMETDNSNELGAGANVDSIDSVHVTYLPLVDYEGKLLPVHFLSAEEVRTRHIYTVYTLNLYRIYYCIWN